MHGGMHLILHELYCCGHLGQVAFSALDLVCGTPLIALERAHPGPGRLLAKAEFLQPGGSVKDRAARAILLAAKADGRLQPGAPVVEMTSGNMGVGLAVACAVLGHLLVVTMSADNSPQRARMLEALGAEVILVPQVDGAPGQVTGADVATAADEAQRLALERGDSTSTSSTLQKVWNDRP
jgi:cysteine synthase